jgi:HK97 family phage portal protein
MGYLRRMLEPVEEKRASFNTVLSDIGWGGRTYAGPSVTEDTAMNYSAVFAAVKVIAEDMAAMPLHLYRQSGRNKEIAREHPMYPILHDLPNPMLTKMEFDEFFYAQALLWGFSAAQKELNRRGKLIALWPLRSSQIEGWQLRDSGYWWAYRKPNGELDWIHSEYLHIMRHMTDGRMLGMSPIRWAARQATGLGLATEEFGARFFSNDARPGIVAKYPGKLSPEARANIKESWNSEHRGLSNSHKLRVLEEGLDIQTIGIPPQDAQFLETRKFQITEIARIFRIPPHLLGDLERATFSNIEEQGQSYVSQTLQPWMVRREKSIYRDLLNESERGRYFAKYNADSLLRGNIAARFASYQIGIMNGMYTPNEPRMLEDMNPIEGLDETWQPVNMVTQSQAAALPAAKPESQRDAEPDMERRKMELRADRVQIFNRYVGLYQDAASRLVKREIADIRRAMTRYLRNGSKQEFIDWLNDFYRDLQTAIPDYYKPTMMSLAEQVFDAVATELDKDTPQIDVDWVDEYLTKFSSAYAVGGAKQLSTDVLDSKPSGEESEGDAAIRAVEDRLTRWKDTRASKTAFDQAFEAGNALALTAMVRLGVTKKEWAGGDCELCRNLNRVVVEIDKPFLQDGDTVEADDENTANLQVSKTIGHPPLHDGCDCVILAA